MKLAYRLPEADQKVKELAGELVKVILGSEVTYQKADDALTEAQRMLLEQTRPVTIEKPPQRD